MKGEVEEDDMLVAAVVTDKLLNLWCGYKRTGFIWVMLGLVHGDRTVDIVGGSWGPGRMGQRLFRQHSRGKRMR